MQKVGGRLVLSPSDFTTFLECPHKTSIRLRRVVDGIAPEKEEEEEQAESAESAILTRHGLDHEQKWLERFKTQGHRVAEIPSSSDDWDQRAQMTVDAMRSGADVIYQAVFVDGDWRGIADFLVRVPTQSDFGDWNYEAWDTKLARKAKPAYVFQLAFYSAQIERVSGRRPHAMRVILGTNETESLLTDDFMSYYRTVRSRFVRFTEERPATYPVPVSHCGRCEFEASCEATWRRDDHLSLVAGIRQDQVERLTSAGIATLAALAGTDPLPAADIAAPTLTTLQRQARLQLSYQTTGQHTYELIPPEGGRGFELLPPSSAGDLFFDMEGDPYFESSGGLEYLFGVAWKDDDTTRYRAWWATSREEEAEAFRGLVDFIRDRLRADPHLHVYHYASYERSKLGHLAQQHATREEELDDLLRRDLFIDLYPAVRQTLRTSHEGYSLKDVRQFFMDDAGEGDVSSAMDSIVEFERWRESGDKALLDAIERYNEEDCISTLRLRDWLLDRKVETEARFGPIAWRPIPDTAKNLVTDPEDPNAPLRQSLLASSDLIEAQPRRVLAGLLDYHRREDKPEWWAYFDRFESSVTELLEDAGAIAGLSPTGEVIAPQGRATSLSHRLAFPPQENRFGAKDKATDFATRDSAGEIVEIDQDRCQVLLKRGPSLASVPLPFAIVAGKPFDSEDQREAVRRVAQHFNDVGISRTDRWTAIADLVMRSPPRLCGRRPGQRVQTLDLAEQTDVVRSLDGGCLAIQGPPGSGKTWTGARLVASLVADGKRVGVAALSHRAIRNFLEELERVAGERGLSFNGVKKSTKGRPDSQFLSANIVSNDDLKDCLHSGIQLVAGTTYCFSPEKMDEALDYLFIDEAGQLSLGDAVAVGTAARNIVLLGDPQQLPHVSHGVHADGVDASVLEHYVDGHAVVPPDRGIFLARTFRMHPDLCRFVSRLSYEGKLESDDSCSRQAIQSSGLSGNGIRFLPVLHSGNAQVSSQEASVVVAEVERLLADGRFTDSRGLTRPMTPTDILVIAPYNMQVRHLRERLPAGVEAGTVDKFQGREAPVVFFSMATSSGEDAPHGREFLFSKNRLNVALSRARSLSVVVASPRLLDVECHSVDDMRLVNALCRLAEESQEAKSG
jgi:predicted RecB family nuclease